MLLRRNRRAPGGDAARSGMILIETLCALLIGLLTGAALLSLMQLTMSVRTTTMGPSIADTEARRQVDTISDKIRNAQSMTVGSVKQVFTAATSSSLTVYSDTAGSTLQLWLDTSVSPAALKQTTVISGVTTTTVVLSGVTALQYTYYEQPSSSYSAASATWTTTANPNVPTSAEWPKIGSVRISLTVSQSGYTRQLYSMVRLRNSPFS